MSGHRTRRRRGHPKGKAWGFHGLRPATKSDSDTQDGSNASTPSAPSQSAPSSPSSGS
jgi:hypothetical protein